MAWLDERTELGFEVASDQLACVAAILCERRLQTWEFSGSESWASSGPLFGVIWGGRFCCRSRSLVSGPDLSPPRRGGARE